MVMATAASENLAGQACGIRTMMRVRFSSISAAILIRPRRMVSNRLLRQIDRFGIAARR